MAVPAYIRRQRMRVRRPIESREAPHLERLASMLRSLRGSAGLTRRELGAISDTSASTIRDIERTTARTRRSTLTRLARALAKVRPELSPAEVLLARLVAAVGPALAPESRYAKQVEERRRRWARKGRFGSKPRRELRIERPLPGETPDGFIRRMAQRNLPGYVCLDCGRAAIGFHPEA